MNRSILIATPYFPYPVFGGGHLALFNEINELRKEYKVILACPQAEENNMLKLKEIWQDVSICVLYNSKNQKRDNKSLFKFILTSIRSKKNESNLFFLQKGFFNTYFNLLNEINEDWIVYLNELIERYNCDIFQTEFYPLINNVFAVKKDILKIFVHHEIGFKKLERNLEITNFSKIYKKTLSEQLKKLEVTYLNQYDKIITLSETDRKHLFEAGVQKEIISSPFPYDANCDSSKSFIFNNRLIFIGGESNFPNLDGISWFINDIWPYLKNKSKELELHIIGKWSDKIKKSLAGEDIIFTGFLKDLDNYVRNSITIVPIRIGSGIRVKILDSFSLGIPVISTSIGAEGLFEDHNIFIANNKQDFENSVREISLGKISHADIFNLYEKIKTNFSKELFNKKRNQIYLN